MATRILNGWKEIAQFMGRGVRTVQRWEAIGLPIRRPNARNRSAVVAFGNELEGWLSRPEGDLLHCAPIIADPLKGTFRYKILVVDANEQQLKTQAALLTNEGHEVQTAQNGFEALGAMRAGIPDLLISSLKMPRMSGFELLWIVRRRLPGVSVIATSREYVSATLPEVFCDCFVENSSSSSRLLGIVRDLIAITRISGED
jgi:CheY-like chemotaxis protein